MKPTETFKNTIKEHLDKRAKEDNLFAVFYAKPDKNINDCITYILNTVKETGCNGFTDDEIFGMALHYYDEDNIDIGSHIECNVAINRHIELTEAEKAQARTDAIEKLKQDTIAGMKKKALPKKTQTVVQSSLFD